MLRMLRIMIINPCFTYPILDRVTHADGKRHYVDPDDGTHLTSVTTILDATSDKTFLIEWRKRVGDKEAERIRTEATGLGSLMHTHLENYVTGDSRPGGNNLVRKMAANMADQIIKHGLCNVDEVWGMEVALHFPNLYAGTTDLVGVHKGQPAILDYKTTKKSKKKADIENYFCQGCAYALAHNLLYNTNITKVVIFMISRDLTYQEFIIEGAEFDAYALRWEERVREFLNMG